MKAFCRDIYQLLKNGGALIWLYFITLYFSIHRFGIYCVVLLGVCAIIYTFKKRYIDKKIVWIALFSCFYVTTLLLSGNVPSYSELIGYAILPYAFYRFGKYMCDKCTTSEQLVLFLLLTMIIFCLNLYISTIYDIISNGFMNLERALETEGREKEMNATLLGLNASLGFAGLVTCFAYEKFYLKVSGVLFLLLSILSLVVVLHLVNRTGLVVIAATTLVVMIHILRKYRGRVVIALLLVLGALFYCIDSGILSEDLFMAYEARNEVTDISSGGDRFWRWGKAIHQMFVYPFGWSTMYIKDYYVHNMWLDVARVAGILPFFCVLIATFLSGKDVYKIYKSIPSVLTTLLLSLYFCCFISAMVEPVIEGLPIYFYIFCMLWGINARLVQ